ncbi:MAG: phospholipid carrier-dependent glycosyltransferase [Planctomycetota bacterium]
MSELDVVASDSPASHDPASHDPAPHDPASHDPASHDPGGEDPGGEDPGGEDPGGEDPAGEGSSAQDPAVEPAPGPEVASTDAEHTERCYRRVAVILVLGAVLATCFGLGARSYDLQDVSRYAQMASEMRAQHTLVPTFNGAPYHQAMPLAAWAPLAVAWLQGGVTPLSSRLLSALSALGTIVVVLLLVWRHGSARLALAAAGILPASLLFVRYAHSSRVDATLGFAVTLGVACAFHAGVTQRRRWWVLGAVAMALGVLAKGPLAAVLIALVAGPPLLYERRGGEVLRGGVPAALLALGLTLAWLLPYDRYLGPTQAHEFMDTFLLQENVAKFEGHLGKVQPAWTYLVELVPAFAPWILLSAWCLWGVLRRPRAATPLERLAACWVLLPLALFSASAGKHIRYMVPVLPGLAILAAGGLERLLQQGAPGGLRRALSGALGALGAGLAIVGVAAPVAVVWKAGLPSRAGVLLCALLLASGAAALLALRRGRPDRALLADYLGVCGALAFAYGVLLPLPTVERKHMEYRLREALAPALPADAALTVVDERLHDDRQSLDELQVGLYLGRPCGRTRPRDPLPPGYLLSPQPLAGHPLLRELDLQRYPHDRWLLLGPSEPPPRVRH